MIKKEAKGYYVLGEVNLKLARRIGHLSGNHWMDQFVHYVKKFHPEPHSFDWSEAKTLQKSGMHHADAARQYVIKKFGGPDPYAMTATFRRAVGKAKVALAKKKGFVASEGVIMREFAVPPDVVNMGVGLIDDVGVAAQTLYNNKKNKKQSYPLPQSGVAPVKPKRSMKYPVKAGSAPMHPVSPSQMESIDFSHPHHHRRRHRQEYQPEVPNPHGSFSHQEKVLDAWRKHHKKAILGAMALGGSVVALSSLYDTWDANRDAAMHEAHHPHHHRIVNYAKHIKKKVKKFHHKYGEDISRGLDIAIHSIHEDQTSLGSTDTMSDEDDAKASNKSTHKKKPPFFDKKDGNNDKDTDKKVSKMTIVYKKEGKKEDPKHDPEYEVPTRDLKKPIHADEPDSTTDDPETDDRRQDIDHHKHETSPEKLPMKHHPHFSHKDAHKGDDETSEPHPGQPSDKKKPSGGPPTSKGSDDDDQDQQQQQSDDEDDSGEESDQPIQRGSRNGEDYKNLPPEHTIKKDPETGDPILPQDDDGAVDKEGPVSDDDDDEETGNQPPQSKSSRMSRAQKLKDIYKNSQSQKDDDQNQNPDDEERNADDTGENDETGLEGKTSQTSSLPVDNNANAADMGDGDESGHNEEEESTEDEPIGKPEKVNFRPIMDPITTQANGV